MALAGEKVVYAGETVTIPLPGGEGRPMRLSGAPCPDVPIYLATLSPRMLRLTGEIADGWLGTSFVPEAAAAYLTDLDAGLAARRAHAAPTSTSARAPRWRSRPTTDELARHGRRPAAGPRVQPRRHGLGDDELLQRRLQPPGLGRGRRAGAGTLARRRPGGAAALVTDEMVLATTLIGTEAMVRDRLAVWQAAGVDTVRLYPAGETLDEQVATLGRAIELVREMAAGVAAG